MAMKDYKMTACLKKKRNVAPQPAEFLASISARYCFDIWGLGYSCFIFLHFYAIWKTAFRIKVSEHLFVQFKPLCKWGSLCYGEMLSDCSNQWELLLLHI